MHFSHSFRMLLIVAVSLFAWGCTVAQQTGPGAKSAREVRTEEQEARRRLEWARTAQAEQDFEHARAYYQEVLDRRSLISPAQILTQATPLAVAPRRSLSCSARGRRGWELRCPLVTDPLFACAGCSQVASPVPSPAASRLVSVLLPERRSGNAE
jgi:hypothetical protein